MNPHHFTRHRHFTLASLLLLAAIFATSAAAATLELAKIKTAPEFKVAVEQMLADETLPPQRANAMIFPPVEVLGTKADLVLAELLASPNRNVRAYAAKALSEAPDLSESTTTALLKLWASEEDYATRQLLVAALNHAGDTVTAQALEHLKTLAVQEPRPDQRLAEIITILGHARSPEAVEPLLALIDTYARRHVVTALGRIGDARGVEPLAAILKDHRSENRDAAAVALLQIGDEPARQVMLAFLESQEGDIAPPIVSALADWREPKLLPVMRRTLKEHDDSRARADAAAWMGMLKAASETPVLLEALKDKYPEVSMAAAVSLHALGRDKQATDEIQATMTQRGGYTHKQKEAVKAIVAIGPGVVPTVSAALRDDKIDLNARGYYAQALGQLGPAGVAAANGLLRDRQPEVRQLAIQALAASGVEKQVPKLEAALDGDPEPFVRRAAALALRDMGWPGYRALLKLVAKPGTQAEATRVAAIAGLRGLSGLPDAALALEKAMADPSPKVRREAAMAWGYFPPEVGIPVLEAAAARERDRMVANGIKQQLEELRRRVK